MHSLCFPAASARSTKRSKCSRLCRRGKRVSFQWFGWIGHAEIIGRRGRNLLPIACLNPDSFHRKIFLFSKSCMASGRPSPKSCSFTNCIIRWRWVRERQVIRLNQALSRRAIADLNEKFADVLRRGEIIQGAALREEKNESE